MNIRRARVLQYIGRLQETRTPAEVTIKFLNLFQRRHADDASVLELLQQNPHISALIQRRLSVDAAGQNDSLAAAVDRLGALAIYRMVAEQGAAQLILLSGNPAGASLEGLWQHSLMTAVIGELVAQKVGQPAAEAYTAGLLHDVGKPVLAAMDKESYRRLYLAAFGSDQDIVELEEWLFGLSHAEAGSRLLAQCDFPPDIVMAVHDHHDVPSGRAFKEMAAILSLADGLAHDLKRGAMVPFESRVKITRSLEILKLGREDLAQVFDEALPLCLQATHLSDDGERPRGS